MHQKVILIDICDTVVDLHNTTVKAAKLDPNIINARWDFFQFLNTEQTRRVHDLFNDPSYWESLPPVQGVHEAIGALRRQGYHVQYVTSPWHTCVGWENIRREWMSREGLVLDKIKDITFTTEKYMVMGDALIDDRPKHVMLWKKAHPTKRSYLFNTDFNRHVIWPRVTWHRDGFIEL